MEGLYAVFHGDALQLGNFGFFVNRGDELLGVGHELVDAAAAFVAEAVAGGAALGVGFEDFLDDEFGGL